MAWSVYQFYVVDETGVVLPGATITVRDTLNAIVVIASDDTGTPMANPFQADEAGLARFFAQSGVYRVEASYGGASWIYDDVPIGSARGADIGDGDHQIRLNEDNDDRFCLRTQPPVVLSVAGPVTALGTWAGRVVRAEAAVDITIPDDFAAGFAFDLHSAPGGTVTLLLDGADVFEPSFGSGAGVTVLAIDAFGWASVFKPAAGIVSVVGQITDATP